MLYHIYECQIIKRYLAAPALVQLMFVFVFAYLQQRGFHMTQLKCASLDTNALIRFSQCSKPWCVYIRQVDRDHAVINACRACNNRVCLPRKMVYMTIPAYDKP